MGDRRPSSSVHPLAPPSPRARAIARRLGPAEVRRRRHRRFALVALVLLGVAAVLLLVLDDGDDGFETQATAVCQEFDQRIRDEFELSFPEGPPTVAAEGEYLAGAFADTVDEMAAELRALDGGDDATAAIDALEARVDEIRADPDPFVAARANPFTEDVAPLFDDLGVPACGSEFLGDPE